MTLTILLTKHQKQADDSDNTVNQASEDEDLVETEVVLALPAPPINFLHLGLQPDELNAELSSHSEQEQIF
jgi:hypothetical protein